MKMQPLEVTRFAAPGAAKIEGWVDFKTTALFVYLDDEGAVHADYNVSERAALQTYGAIEMYANLQLLAAILLIEDGTSSTSGTNGTRQHITYEPFRAERTGRKIPVASDGKVYLDPEVFPEGVVPSAWLE